MWTKKYIQWTIKHHVHQYKNNSCDSTKFSGRNEKMYDWTKKLLDRVKCLAPSTKFTGIVIILFTESNSWKKNNDLKLRPFWHDFQTVLDCIEWRTDCTRTNSFCAWFCNLNFNLRCSILIPGKILKEILKYEQRLLDSRRSRQPSGRRHPTAGRCRVRKVRSACAYELSASRPGDLQSLVTPLFPKPT